MSGPKKLLVVLGILAAAAAAVALPAILRPDPMELLDQMDPDDMQWSMSLGFKWTPPKWATSSKATRPS